MANLPFANPFWCRRQQRSLRMALSERVADGLRMKGSLTQLIMEDWVDIHPIPPFSSDDVLAPYATMAAPSAGGEEGRSPQGSLPPWYAAGTLGGRSVDGSKEKLLWLPSSLLLCSAIFRCLFKNSR